MAEIEPPPASSAAPSRPDDPLQYDGLSLAKHLLRSVKAGALATIEQPAGHPFASLASLATDYDGSPILLTSNLSAHTRNMKADPRVSLLMARGGKGDPLAHPRLTLLGRALQEQDPTRRARLKARFLARHPKAALYADFGDFSFWRLEVSRAHLNGGFAKAADFTGAAVLTDIADAQDLIEAESGALTHLNAACDRDRSRGAGSGGRRSRGAHHVSSSRDHCARSSTGAGGSRRGGPQAVTGRAGVDHILCEPCFTCLACPDVLTSAPTRSPSRTQLRLHGTTRGTVCLNV
jgi:hypothetical protein